MNHDAHPCLARRQRGRRTRGAIVCGAVAALAATAGCGGDGPPRYRVCGAVTYHGEPVPGGVIFFDPDVAGGNSGLQGFAEIQAGRYDTSRGAGKGITGGGYVLRVRGFDAATGNPLPLFDERRITVDFPRGNAMHDIDISDAASHGDTPYFEPT